MVAKVNDIESGTAVLSGSANDKSEPSIADTVITSAAQLPVGGMPDAAGKSFDMGWLVVAAAFLLAIATVGTAVWEHRKSERKD